MAAKAAVKPTVAAQRVILDPLHIYQVIALDGAWHVSSASQGGMWRVYEHPVCGLRCACPGFSWRGKCRHLEAVRAAIIVEGEQRAAAASEAGRDVAGITGVAGDIRPDGGAGAGGEAPAVAAVAGRHPWAVGRIEGQGALMTVWPAEGPHRGHQVAVRRASEGCAVRCRQCGDAAGYFERTAGGRELGAGDLAPERYELPSATAATRAAVGGWRGGREIL